MGWKTKPSWGKLKAWTNDTPWFGQTVPWGENETGPPDLTVVEGGKKAAAKKAHPTSKKAAKKRR